MNITNEHQPNHQSRTIEDIYKTYKIMPQLAEHQLRVAAVAKYLADNINIELDTKAIIEACLLHDMGNILKFDLTKFPQFLEPLGLGYWQRVKKEVEAKYKTSDEHVATKKIAEELNVSKAALDCLDSIGFSRVPAIVDDPSFEHKICCYADQRVAPFGVVSLQERLKDGRKRYIENKRSTLNLCDFEAITKSLESLEQQIFNQIPIEPSQVADDSIGHIVDNLRNYSVWIL